MNDQKELVSLYREKTHGLGQTSRRPLCKTFNSEKSKIFKVHGTGERDSLGLGEDNGLCVSFKVKPCAWQRRATATSPDPRCSGRSGGGGA